MNNKHFEKVKSLSAQEHSRVVISVANTGGNQARLELDAREASIVFEALSKKTFPTQIKKPTESDNTLLED